MSLMKTLAKVAVGVAVAKGASAMVQRRAGAAQTPGGGLLGQLQRQMQQRPEATQSRGGIEDMLGGILGGGAGSAGLGGLLEQLGGGVTGTRGGGLDDLLGGLAGAGAAGGIGGLLGGLLTGGTPDTARGGFGDVLNQAIARQDEPDTPPTTEQELAAGLMLRAMIQAAKCDGKLDDAEQARLLDKLGDVSPEEQAFVQAELQAPVDVAGLAGQVPQGLEPQVYAMSVMAIDLDSQPEAQYLHGFAQALGLQPQTVNHIHDQLGVPTLYT
ncbi:Uncharacterized membrane protein YebE, DUF533 family [Lutimaribacter pacificus]|uniref:Uncharacterized membrane protein YebE, DUF533 family n=1 Tax=Lutimaribacter pacificus TaxID=391948 RepID=A0A1H0F3Q7_9RHOB|nr:DUF533 domain-containing protein [Lutimaribacter pacificus]SDN89169.1 Uncharacterized membrane protein YebE, DUF533 family [Lutimaribacter pacificus]SHK44279.1 Uncharacterized membrane protein YebE, DUF533 family [Lutimaribacter pacificus]